MMMNKNETHNLTLFDVKGALCKLVITEDRDEDGTKMCHDLINVETNEVVATLDWSPYSEPSDQEVQQLIDLGLPRGLCWEHSNPGTRFNFDSDSLALYLSGEVIDKSHGKLVLVTKK
tara:strand:+ start:1011 stop:1364 length:354 start_codon:yes stop_codon:yes gene_type:complete